MDDTSGSTGAFGERLKKTFKVDRAPSLVARTLKNASIAVTEIRCDRANTGFSEPIPVEDAFLLVVQLRDVPAHDMFLDGRQIGTAFLPAGTACLYDLRTSPVANSLSPFHHISLYVPRAALMAIAEKEGIAPVDAFAHDPGIGVHDPILHGLAGAMLQAFRSPRLANRLFIDHVTVAATAHAVRVHGSTAQGPYTAGPKLSQREESRAKEKLAEGYAETLSLDEFSEGAAMPPLAFASAFSETVGLSIHAWRHNLRMERARRMLARGYDLDQTANLLGYADTADFLEDFQSRTGFDPRAFAS